MQSYVKRIKIVPELDLSKFQNEWSGLVKEVGKISDDLRKPFDNLQKDFSFDVTKNENIKIIKDDINEGIENKSYLKEDKSINDFFKGLQKELTLIPESRDKMEKEEKIQDLSSYMDYLQDNMNVIQKYISENQEKLSQTEGYDLYQAKEQFAKNEREISSLKLEDDGDIQNQKRLEELIKINQGLKEKISNLSKEEYDFTEIESALKNINELTDEYNDLMEKYTEAESDKEELEESGGGGTDWEKVGKTVGKYAANKLESALNKFVDSFGKLLSNALDEFDEMSQYNLETSLRVNSDVREQALQYGLSSAQNYAFDKVKDVMGISSEEDLYMMTPEQQNRFAELIGKYTSQYQEIADKDLFSKYEEYQAAVQDFQDELQLEIIEFFAENKDTIISVMEFLMDALSAILDVVTWINETLRSDEEMTSEENSAMVSDIINSYSVSNSKTTNVKIDNSFSNISPSDQSQYINAGKRVNEQLIAALNE